MLPSAAEDGLLDVPGEVPAPRLDADIATRARPTHELRSAPLALDGPAAAVAELAAYLAAYIKGSGASWWARPS